MTPAVESRRKSVLLAEEVWYLPTYIVDDKPPRATGECSLFVRRFRLVETPKGGPRIDVAGDVWSFPSAELMADAILSLGLQELPADAERDQLYVPESVMVDGAKVQREFKRIPPPESTNSQESPS